MDQHPVPQNVTTFQFRLIGDMTIKQFGHLAGGAILAYISYKLPLPFFFSWPLTIIFALGGIGFAFVPIEERPMDVWVLSFLKNVYSPTVYVWEKSQNKPTQQAVAPVQRQAQTVPAPRPVQQQPMQTFAPQGQQPTQQGAKTTASVVTNMYAAKTPTGQAVVQQRQYQMQQHQQQTPKPGMFDWLSGLFAPKPHAAAPINPLTAPHMATPSVVGAHIDMSIPPAVTTRPAPPAQKQPDQTEKAKETIDEKVSSLKHELEDGSISQARILELQKQLTEVLMQKDKMAAEMQQLQNQLNNPPAQAVTPPPIAAAPVQTPIAAAPPVQQAPPAQKQPTVKIITPEGAVKAGLPRLTTFPNVVTGITRDSDNNFLPGVLVTVKDKDGVPVRALKTNRLGQFAASTPLSNGVYFVEIEDPRQRYIFDRVQITLNGSIVPALEIITKSQKQISRDKLAKELFGNTG